MGYTSKNPKFDSTILTDITSSTPSNPASGTTKVVNRNGVLYTRDSSGNEVAMSLPSTTLLGDVKATNVSATATMTIATPCVVTYTSHGLATGAKVYFTTTGALPTGVSASTTYYITKIDANTFKLSTSFSNLMAGTYVATSGSQSGTHTIYTGGLILNTPIFTNWTSDTISLITPNNLGTVSGTSYWWKRDADCLKARGYLVFGTPASATASLSLATNFVIDSTKYGSATSKQIVGRYHRINSTATSVDAYQSAYAGVLFYDGSDTTKVYFASANASSAYTKNNADNLFSSGQSLNFEFEVPITAWAF